jgi:hypothetical protein
MARFEADPKQAVVTGPGRPAALDSGRMTRLRAMFLVGLDGWIDDHIALVRPWGFDLARITGPVSIWHGAEDTHVPRARTDWLLGHVPAARGYEHPGGHDPDDASYRRILSWIGSAA